jgi:hypothetical protein
MVRGCARSTLRRTNRQKRVFERSEVSAIVLV